MSTNEFKPAEGNPNPDRNALGDPQIAWSEEGTPLAGFIELTKQTNITDLRTKAAQGSPIAYRCTCGGKVVRAILYDHLDIGAEWQWICRGPCGRTHGASWVENLWGKSEPPTVLDFALWTEVDPLAITRQLLVPRPAAWSGRLLLSGAAGLIAYLLIALVLNGIDLRISRALSGILI